VLKENGDKLAAEKKAPVEHAVNELKEALKSGVIGTIKAKQEALNTAMQAVAQELYAKTGPQQPGGPAADGNAGGAQAPGDTGSKPDSDGVIDADFTMVDDDKKK
jgi:molecular chaperone DnaK